MGQGLEVGPEVVAVVGDGEGHVREEAEEEVEEVATRVVTITSGSLTRLWAILA